MKPPALFDYRRSAAMTFLALPLGLRAERLYQNLPRISSIDIPQYLPSLSIIIPARNEEANLSVLLPSLCSLRYPGPLEILVVDDQSTDQTAAVAQAHGAGLLRLDHLPSGWLGKPFACHQGAQAARVSGCSSRMPTRCTLPMARPGRGLRPAGAPGRAELFPPAGLPALGRPSGARRRFCRPVLRLPAG